MTLAEIFQANEGKGPSFDMLRLFAALLVVFSHAFFITGAPNEAWSLVTRQVSAGGFAVAVFFVLSGYVVTESLKRNPAPWGFLRRRAFRICPALITVVLVTVFLYGPAMTTLPLQDYFTAKGTFIYAISALFPMKEVLPGVFQNAPSEFVNGNLWTLRYEFVCYAALALFGGIIIARPRVALGATIGLILLLGLLPTLRFTPSWAFMQFIHGLPLFACFGGGVCVSLYAGMLPVTRGWIVAAVFLFLLSLETVGLSIVFPFVGAYLVAVVGNSRLLAFPNLRRGIWAGDFSYGIYIIGFPVQQAVRVASGGNSPWWANLLLSLPIVLVLAMLSWHFIEKPFLRLKYAGPSLFSRTT